LPASSAPVKALDESVKQVTPDVEKLVSSMASTFQGIIESLVKELQPAQKNKYLEASKSLSEGKS
jgi:CII-binding regulator of phage lambda lysogenization HflD